MPGDCVQFWRVPRAMSDRFPGGVSTIAQGTAGRTTRASFYVESLQIMSQSSFRLDLTPGYLHTTRKRESLSFIIERPRSLFCLRLRFVNSLALLVFLFLHPVPIPVPTSAPAPAPAPVTHRSAFSSLGRSGLVTVGGWVDMHVAWSMSMSSQLVLLDHHPYLVVCWSASSFFFFIHFRNLPFPPLFCENMTIKNRYLEKERK